MPAIYVKTSGSFETVNQPWVRTGGAWTPILNIWVKTGGVWELTWTGFTAAASPDEVFGFGGGVVGAVTSDFSTATPTGGVGPFTYSWARVSGDPLVATDPSFASSAFRLVMGAGTTASAVFECEVTDTTTGLVETTNTVTAYLDNN